MPKLPQSNTNIQEPKQRKRETVKKNIDPGRPISRPMAEEVKNTNWGKQLTKPKWVKLMKKLDQKKKEREMSKLSDTLAKALAKKQGKTHVDGSDANTTVERGLWLVAFCSMEMAGDRPSIKSTSGLSISCKNWRA